MKISWHTMYSRAEARQFPRQVLAHNVRYAASRALAHEIQKLLPVPAIEPVSEGTKFSYEFHVFTSEQLQDYVNSKIFEHITETGSHE